MLRFGGADGTAEMMACSTQSYLNMGENAGMCGGRQKAGGRSAING
jgi:hypothetical protein